MKVISFNSYKGGACRTTTCYNTLPYLARALHATSEEPILVYDIDLDSMGLTSIFHAGKPPVSSRLPYSAKHLFVDENDMLHDIIRDMDDNGLKSKFFGYHEKVGNQLGLEDDGSVLFLGADKNERTASDDDYLKYAECPPIQQLMSAMKEMTSIPKAIVFDCASGVQMSTLVALQIADCSVMCMRPTYQFRVGTSDYIVNKIPTEIDKNKNGKTREIILLPTAVANIDVLESDPDYEKSMTMLNKLRDDSLRAIQKDIVFRYANERKRIDLGYTLNTAMLEDRDDPVVGIPEIERFKWEEELLYKLKDEEKTTQEKALEKRYEKLACLIAK